MSSKSECPIPTDLIGLCEAAAMLPSRKPGKRLNASVLYRWIRQSKLLAWRIGGHWYVSKKDIENLPKLCDEAPPRLVTAKKREKEIAEADRILREAGIKR